MTFENDVGLTTARERSRALADYARAELAELPGVRVLDRGAEFERSPCCSSSALPSTSAARGGAAEGSCRKRLRAVLRLEDSVAFGAQHLRHHGTYEGIVVGNQHQGVRCGSRSASRSLMPSSGLVAGADRVTWSVMSQLS